MRIQDSLLIALQTPDVIRLDYVYPQLMPRQKSSIVRSLRVDTCSVSPFHPITNTSGIDKIFMKIHTKKHKWNYIKNI